MNKNRIFIYLGALSSILGMTLFDGQIVLKYTLLIGGIILVVIGLKMNSVDESIEEKEE